jgi:D-alanine-D-alanine ligase
VERSRKIPWSWPNGNFAGSLDSVRDDRADFMTDLPKKIAVLMGGPGSEREVSLATGRGVAKALRSLGAEVVEVDVRNEDFELPKDVDLAFITIHGTFGEDGQIQKILERRGVAYTGDGVSESEIAFDKIRTKQKFQEHGVTTPPWEVIHVGQRPTIPLPIVVKPAREGSTVGVVIVKNENELASAIGESSKYDRELLIEKFVSGRELTIGILGDQALPIIEIIPKGGFYDFNNKYPFLNPQAGGGAEHVCPADIDAEKTNEIQQLALRAFQAAGLQVYARVDVILPDNEQPTVLEINTIPGMTEASLLPEAAAAAGIGYADLCTRIIALSRVRQGSGRQAQVKTEGKR